MSLPKIAALTKNCTPKYDLTIGDEIRKFALRGKILLAVPLPAKNIFDYLFFIFCLSTDSAPLKMSSHPGPPLVPQNICLCFP